MIAIILIPVIWLSVGVYFLYKEKRSTDDDFKIKNTIECFGDEEIPFWFILIVLLVYVIYSPAYYTTFNINKWIRNLPNDRH